MRHIRLDDVLRLSQNYLELFLAHLHFVVVHLLQFVEAADDVFVHLVGFLQIYLELLNLRTFCRQLAVE
jgi:hypothetical protein